MICSHRVGAPLCLIAQQEDAVSCFTGRHFAGIGLSDLALEFKFERKTMFRKLKQNNIKTGPCFLISIFLTILNLAFLLVHQLFHAFNYTFSLS